MQRPSKYYSLFAGQIFLAVILVMCLLGLTGCGGTYGRLVVNSDVKALFERYEVLPDHQYFHSGLAPHPRTVIGLHKDYTLQSDFWNPVVLTPAKLQRWLRIQDPHNTLYLYYNGSDILDAEGKKIGVWFGLKDSRDWAVVTMIDAKTVNITLPTPRKNVRRFFPGLLLNQDD